jgi:hypothetical protein
LIISATSATLKSSSKFAVFTVFIDELASPDMVEARRSTLVVAEPPPPLLLDDEDVGRAATSSRGELPSFTGLVAFH